MEGCGCASVAALGGQMWLLALVACTPGPFTYEMSQGTVPSGQWSVSWDWATVSDDCLGSDDAFWYTRETTSEYGSDLMWVLERECPFPASFDGTCTERLRLADWNHSYEEIPGGNSIYLDTDSSSDVVASLGLYTPEASESALWQDSDGTFADDDGCYFVPNGDVTFTGDEIGPDTEVTQIAGNWNAAYERWAGWQFDGACAETGPVCSGTFVLDYVGPE